MDDFTPSVRGTAISSSTSSSEQREISFCDLLVVTANSLCRSFVDGQSHPNMQQQPQQQQQQEQKQQLTTTPTTQGGGKDRDRDRHHNNHHHHHHNRQGKETQFINFSTTTVVRQV